MTAALNLKESTREIILVGNPNSGKTSIFNALTGLRHQTANYPGVTVEKRMGLMKGTQPGEEYLVLDLPGAYSLLPRSLDEEVVHNVLLGIQDGTDLPDLAVVILDTSNFERNMYFASQVIETGIPTILVLNMWDLAIDKGLWINLKKLKARTECPCIKTIGNRWDGIQELKRAITQSLSDGSGKKRNKRKTILEMSPAVEEELKELETVLSQVLPRGNEVCTEEALRILSDTHFRSHFFASSNQEARLKEIVEATRARLEAKGIDWSSYEMEVRYAWVNELKKTVLRRRFSKKISVSDRLDNFLTHRIWGVGIFLSLMAAIFQSIFSFATLPMDLFSSWVAWLGGKAADVLPAGQLESLVVDGMIAGVGNVIVFLPQIFLLFLFIAILEDTGYMARAAFVLDRVMSKVGLNGKAFLPLFGSFACAVPGIMSTRMIEDRKDRLATILVAPLMSCSARLPIYTLLIAAFIPAVPLLGIFDLKGVTLLSLYLLSIVSGLLMATLFRKTLLKGRDTPFVFELPPYRVPNARTVLLSTWDRGREFLTRAGTIIFCMSIILWFLTSYPKHSDVEKMYQRKVAEAERSLDGSLLEDRVLEIERTCKSEEIKRSYLGQMGRFIEPVIQPLGFDWKIGVGLLGAFTAREVFISTLAIVYNVGDHEGATVNLAEALRRDRNLQTGKPRYTPLVAVALMVFFVLACQCMSTIAVVKQETGRWRWALFLVAYMTALAWMGAFFVYQGGRLLGLE